MAMQKFDDELDTLPQATTAASQPVNGKAQTTTQTATAASTGTEIDFGNEEYTSRATLPRIKPGAGEFVRFALINRKAMAKEVHYVQGSGSYQCFGTGCPLCSKEQSRTRIVALAVRYTNADPKTGKIVSKPLTYEVGHLQLSRANYTSISGLPDEDSNVYTPDFKMTFDGKRYEFSIAGSQAAYIKLGDQQAVEELVAPFMDGEELRKKLGKTATAIELRLLASGGGVELGRDAQLPDLET